MPQRVAPRPLKTIAKKRILSILENFFNNLISLLEESPRRNYARRTITMKQLCSLSYGVHDYIFALPRPDMNAMAQELMEVFGKAALKHFYFLATTSPNESENLFKLALHPRMEALNIRDLSSDVLRLWAVLNMQSVAGAKTLLLPKSFINSGAIARNVSALHWLTEFEYPDRCTDAVVKALRYCHNSLSKLRVQGSKGVTNISVKYLKKLPLLTFLNISSTRIDRDNYALLLKILPLVENIHWSDEVDAFVGETNIDFPRIQIMDSKLAEPRRMFTKCTSIVSVSLTRVKENDLSALLQTNVLQELKLKNFDYKKTLLESAFLHLGKTLKVLWFLDMSNVEARDVINFCPILETLKFEFCTFVTPPTLPHPGVEHYQNLRQAIVVFNQLEFNYIESLRHYKNLKSLILLSHNLDDAFIARSIDGLRSLETFTSSSHNLTYETLKLLISKCENIREIGYINNWNSISNAHIRFIRNEIINGNYDLEILL